ncbi:MAG: hypothetical protein HYW49_11760 [Deltaproteobacteria bacterium]|nr:hypothetical protein [Deltaproteobacteria bacterium]
MKKILFVTLVFLISLTALAKSETSKRNPASNELQLSEVTVKDCSNTIRGYTIDLQFLPGNSDKVAQYEFTMTVDKGGEEHSITVTAADYSFVSDVYKMCRQLKGTGNRTQGFAVKQGHDWRLRQIDVAVIKD